MHMVTAADVHRICDWRRLVDALMAAHRGPTPLADRSELHAGREDARDTFLNLPAWQPGIAMGTKIVTVMPGNPASSRVLPAVQAAYVLFDGTTGTPVAVMDGTALTYRKTAADSALGARFLARREARILLMVGAGALAPYLIAAHRAATPSIGEVMVWNRDRSKAERLAVTAGGTVAPRSGAGGAHGRHHQLRHVHAPAARQGRVAGARRSSRSRRSLHARHARMR